MGLLDYVYRLKAEAGDTTPHDELAVSGDLTGGTIALVDRGGGDSAWRFSVGMAQVPIPAKALAQTTQGGGMTIAMTVRIENYGTTEYQHFFGVGPDAPPAATSSSIMSIGRSGSGNLRARFNDQASPPVWAATTGVDHTIVETIEMNYAGTSPDRLVVQHDAITIDGGGTTAPPGITVDTLWVQATNGVIVQVKDFVVWHEELPLVDREAMRDSGIRAVLDAAAVSDITGSITLADLETSGSLASNVALLTGDLSIADVLASGALGLVPGSIRTLPFARNNGTRPTGLINVALAVLSDDASLLRLAGSAAIVQNGDGTISFSGAGLPSVGASVIVLTREPDGKIGAERYLVA